MQRSLALSQHRPCAPLPCGRTWASWWKRSRPWARRASCGGGCTTWWPRISRTRTWRIARRASSTMALMRYGAGGSRRAGWGWLENLRQDSCFFYCPGLSSSWAGLECGPQDPSPGAPQVGGDLGERLKAPWEWVGVLDQVASFGWTRLDLRSSPPPHSRGTTPWSGCSSCVFRSSGACGVGTGMTR
jgi:hypothetical protein